ncbi:MAG: hypothetical protein WDA60_16630 [Acidimicrobiia bacterium]
MTDTTPRPAYYAAGPGRLREWWTILHPPYTAWHLAYVVIGASLAPSVHAGRLVASLVAFFAAVGVAAHALDELHGRPLRTHIPTRTLEVAAAAGLLVAVGLGIAGITVVGWWLAPFVVAGPVLALGYNLELFGGRIHTDLGFAVAWGAFPVLTAYVAQTDTIRLDAVVVAGAALLVSLAQRALSTPARTLRRRTRAVSGRVELADGRTVAIDTDVLLAPLERALRCCSWAMVTLAAGLLLVHAT